VSTPACGLKDTLQIPRAESTIDKAVISVTHGLQGTAPSLLAAANNLTAGRAILQEFGEDNRTLYCWFRRLVHTDDLLSYRAT
jgi:hypothetical protein